jgi:hypothetical protein
MFDYEWELYVIMTGSTNIYALASSVHKKHWIRGYADCIRLKEISIAYIRHLENP